MRCHVFIVNDSTLPSHLRYLFAGTTAGEKDFNTSLLSDISRVRPGDLVIFYIEATKKDDGGFFGIFRIARQEPSVFHVRGLNGKKPGLGKKLIYRTLIEPFEVYTLGVPEWKALDKLPQYSREIQWSLIYRKLKGKRGCTPVLPWEAEKLVEMIRRENRGKLLADKTHSGGFDWDITKRRIITKSKREPYPYERSFRYNVLGDINRKKNDRHAYEDYLQLYFTENIGIKPDLSPIVGEKLIWFGNEVACGVGMRKIDIASIYEHKEQRYFRLIELKDELAKRAAVRQVEKYVNWASQDIGGHLEGAYDWNIIPVLVAPRRERKNNKWWRDFVDALVSYNAKRLALPIEYFEFRLENTNKIVFESVAYD